MNFVKDIDFSDQIIKGVKSTLAPDIKKVLSYLEKDKYQKQATNEHRQKAKTINYDAEIIALLDRIYKKLPSRHPVKKKIKTHLYGDEELGFLPALLAAAPLISTAVGGLMGGNKGKSSPAPSGGNATDILAPILAAIQDAKLSDIQVKDIVKELIATVPPPIRNQVKASLEEFKRTGSDKKQTISNIVGSIDKQFAPQIDASLKILQESALQKVATNEHRIKVAEENRWKTNSSSQARILKRLDDLENRVVKKNIHNANVATSFGVAEKFM